MNPNPEQDAPFTTGKFTSKGPVLFHGDMDIDEFDLHALSLAEATANAALTAKAFNAATALHAAGWDAARVFERLPEVMEALEASAGTIASLVNHNSPCADKTLSEIIHILAQLKLKRDTAGGGR